MTTWRTTLRRRSDLGTIVTDLAGAKGWRWQERLNDAGAASFVLAEDDPDLALIQPSDFVVIEVDGVPAFTMVIRDLERTVIDVGEEAAQLTTVSGLSSVAVLDEVLVYGIRPLWCWPIEDDRLFSWPAFDYDDSAWPRPIVLARWDDPTYWSEGSVIGAAPAPGDFPDPDGTWMWAPATTWQYAPAGTCYFRGVFNVPATYNKVGVYFAADDVGHIYFDGQRIGENTWTLEGWRCYNETIEVTPGLHVIGVEATNAYDPASEASGDHNPGGVLCTVYGLGAGGERVEVLLRSDDQWVVLPYPDPPPGMTPGEVIGHCVREAQARGGLVGVTLSFDDDVDSDGTPWPLLGEVSTKIGYDLLTFLRELANTYIDFAMDPASLVLHAWVHDGRGTDTGVDHHGVTDPTDPANALLVRWVGGWLEVTNPAAIAAGGRREAFLDLSAQQTEFEARRVAQAQLDAVAGVRTETSIDVAPVGPADEPFVAYDVGDYIHVPNWDGVPTATRVVALAGAVDDNGAVSFSADLSDQVS